MRTVVTLWSPPHHEWPAHKNCRTTTLISKWLLAWQPMRKQYGVSSQACSEPRTTPLWCNYYSLNQQPWDTGPGPLSKLWLRSEVLNDSALLWMHWLISASNLMMESEMSVGKALSLHPIQIHNDKYSKSAFQVLVYIQYLSAVKTPHITD